MRIDIHLHLDDDVSGSVIVSKLNQILSLLRQEIFMDQKTQDSLDKLNAAVAAETDVETSVETLLTGLSKQIADLKAGQSDPSVIAAIDAATAIVTANVTKASAAVAANTGV